jgi:hypothetical protein
MENNNNVFEILVLEIIEDYYIKLIRDNSVDENIY